MDSYITERNFIYIKKIGNGQCGNVHLISDQEGNQFALKIVDTSELVQEKVFTRSQREYQLLEILHKQNPQNIVKPFDFYFDNKSGYIFIQMEYCEIGDLNNYLKKNQLTYNEKMSLIYQLIQGMQVLYINKIIHRDLKPDNIFLKYSDQFQCLQLKIGDFGISNYAELLSISKSAGNLHYKPPEITLDEDYQCDSEVYSVGLLILCILLNNTIFLRKQYKISNGSELSGIQLICYKQMELLFKAEGQQFLISTKIFNLVSGMVEDKPNERIKWVVVFKLFSKGLDFELNQDFDDIYSNYKKSIQSNSISNIDNQQKYFTEYTISKIMNDCINNITINLSNENINYLYKPFCFYTNPQYFAVLHLALISIKVDFIERLCFTYLSFNHKESIFPLLKSKQEIQQYLLLKSKLEALLSQSQLEIEKISEQYEKKFSFYFSDSFRATSLFYETLKNARDIASGHSHFCKVTFENRLKHIIGWMLKNKNIKELTKDDAALLFIICLFIDKPQEIINGIKSNDSQISKDFQMLQSEYENLPKLINMLIVKLEQNQIPFQYDF